MSSVMEKAFGFLRLIRPVNCIMMGFAVIVGAFIVTAGAFSSSFDVLFRLALGFLTSFTLAGASMAINDYWDRDIDKINEPRRPIPSGVVSPNGSLVLAAILTLIGLTAAVRTNLSCLVVATLSWVVSVAYTTRGKRTGLPGNLLVSLCIAIPFIYGSYVIKGELEPPALIFAALAFLSTTGREVTKGIVDVQGDNTKNIKTMAISHGERTAAYVASTFYILASCLSVLPIYLRLVSFWFVPFVLLADSGFVTASVLLIRDHSRENAKRIKSLALVSMIFGLLAFITGAIIK